MILLSGDHYLHIECLENIVTGAKNFIDKTCHTVGELISILAEDKEGLAIRIGRNSLSEVVCKLEELGLLSDC